MIPKLLHFVWFGQKPEYVGYSIDAFSRMNPDFTILMWDKPEKFSVLQKQIADSSGKYKNSIDYFKKLGRKPIQILSNIARMEILNEIGGIYLDCDCFPRRYFDEDILRENFIVKRLYTKDFYRRDCFFIGKMPGTEDITDYRTFKCREILLNTTYDAVNLEFLKRKNQFKRGILKRLPSTESYIEHFNMKEWDK